MDGISYIMQVFAPKIVTIDGQTEAEGNAVTRYTPFFNMTGHPAITLPCGMHSAGLPIAAQLIGKHYGDEKLIETASLIESSYDFKLPLSAFNSAWVHPIQSRGIARCGNQHSSG
jgi:aspartyl-tRNA(Asn)/glutamyl-tRNA(Gln) amidotransferase subunit A